MITSVKDEFPKTAYSSLYACEVEIIGLHYDVDGIVSYKAKLDHSSPYYNPNQDYILFRSYELEDYQS